MNDAALLASPLFRGATSEEIAAMLPCLGASPRRFARGERILRAGEPTRYMGLVLTGSVLIEHTDMQGTVTLLGRAEPATCLRRPMPVHRMSRCLSTSWPARPARCSSSTQGAS